jgi:O-antigen ligase
MLGAWLTVHAALFSIWLGPMLTLGLLVVLALLLLITAAFMAAPHLAVAVTIPVFALLPTLKVVAFPWIGPLKDLITLGAIGAAAILVIQRSSAGERVRGDGVAAGLVGLLVGLYLLNIGGALDRDAAWLHGVRLACIPLLLLLVGFLLGNSRRTLRFAAGSLIVTAVAEGAIGILQQLAGAERLVALGYEYSLHIRTIDGRLRSFGTFDDPFAYAAFLLFGLAAVLLWMRKGPAAFGAAGVILAGLTFSLARSALIIGLVLLGLWLVRHRQTTVSFFLMAFAIGAAVILLARSSEATEGRTVRAGPNFFLTVNGRTDVWKVVFEDAGDLPFGRGVGEIGTAAERATYTVSRTADEAREAEAAVVDSSYFAALADVGIIGLALILALFGRLLALAAPALRRRRRTGALALGLLAIMAIDPLARESLTGFPTAFLGFLLIGLALSAAEDEDAAAKRASPRARLA